MNVNKEMWLRLWLVCVVSWSWTRAIAQSYPAGGRVSLQWTTQDKMRLTDLARGLSNLTSFDAPVLIHSVTLIDQMHRVWGLMVEFPDRDRMEQYLKSDSCQWMQRKDPNPLEAEVLTMTSFALDDVVDFRGHALVYQTLQASTEIDITDITDIKDGQMMYQGKEWNYWTGHVRFNHTQHTNSFIEFWLDCPTGQFHAL